MNRTRVQFYQWALALGGFHPSAPASLDGLLGPTTTTATQAYQRARGILVTGAFDAATVALLNADAERGALAGHNAPASLPSARPAVTGSHPAVAAIQTKATAFAPAQAVVVPSKVAQMLPPSTVAQLQTMPAPAVQSFVNDLVRKVETAENAVLSTGTGKDFTAVPMVAPDGTVVAAVQQVNTALQSAGWWARLTPNERIGYGVGGAVVGVALVGGLVYLFSGKDRR